MKRHSRPRVALIGAGKLARSLAPLLRRARYCLGAIAAPRLSRARELAQESPPALATTRPERAAGEADLVLLAVPDRHIEGLARKLAEAPRIDWAGRTVLHHAGALGLELLEPLRLAGAAIGVLHPLQCLGSPDLAAKVLPGSWARIDGDRRGRAVASRLARDLGLAPLAFPRDLNAGQRVAYHAAASLVSNDVVALLDLAAELLVSLGLTRSAALAALAPLLRGTLLQFESRGLEGAFTGPVRRGDLTTLSAQLARLELVAAEAREAHASLSLLLARAASRCGIELPRGTRTGLLGLIGRRPGAGL